MRVERCRCPGLLVDINFWLWLTVLGLVPIPQEFNTSSPYKIWQNIFEDTSESVLFYHL